MKKLVLTLVLISLSTFSFSFDLSGRWDCKLSNLTEDDYLGLKKREKITLNVSSDGKTYLREGDFRWEFTSDPSLVVHIQSIEEGVLEIEDQNITFSPLKGDVKVLDIGPLNPKDLERDLLEELLADEDWIIKEYSFKKVIFERPSTGYIDSCTKQKKAMWDSA